MSHEIRLDEEIKIKEIIGKDNPVILECGAHDGTTTKEFLKRFPYIKLFCFEPDPRNVIKFKKNVQDNRCKLIEVAISHMNGKILLHQSYASSFEHTDSSTIKQTSNHMKNFPWMLYKEPILVNTMRLDTWREKNNIGDVDFIWADVEGAEEELIKGAIKTLDCTHYFYTEYSNMEIYNNEITLDDIKNLLPNFVMIKCWIKDVLFQNKRFL